MIILMILVTITVVLYFFHDSASFPSLNSQDQRTPAPFPSVFSLPKFPLDVQSKLDNKEPCHKISSYRHKIIRVLQESMAQHTLYPSNSDYVSVVKALPSKYPFLRDAEGNGYVDEDCFPSIGEDATSINAHVKTLQDQYKKTQPDAGIVDEKIKLTFAWRRREIVNGTPVAEIFQIYPFLRTPSVLFQEMGRMHDVSDLSRRFQVSFSKIVPSVLRMAKGKSAIEAQYMDAREEAVAENLCDMDFRAALVLLPVIFREKVDNYVIIGVGQDEPATPYPTVQILGTSNWKQVFSEKRVFTTVKMEGSEICQAVGVEDGVLSAFCSYFVFNLAYPSHNRNTLLFLQRHVLKVTTLGDKPLPTAVVRIINLLF
ncbi:uncharacterized protein LOC130421303 isoform X1 [Triplophysa dalaica]|uniref:uncharacterized protein LOC130421303 isoform X1 n=1 Tax=Triplophysa dalaica TaxID=1582913 RepID=UPI0024DFFF1C|nr:uncharacterized protein LOC130421303 isoform X1 [Triplophysa dalaica]